MNVKTITTWADYNYGASLQAYALTTYIKRRGHDVQMINYLPDYQTRMYDYMWVNPESKATKYWITRWIYRCAKFVQRLTTLKRKRIFDEFNFHLLPITEKCYHSSAELKQDPPSADLYIVGSDQVWNVLYDAGRDPSFYLDFVKQGKKTSYAASLSYIDIDEENKLRIAKYLKTFDGIAVREYHGVDLLNSLNINSTWVLDPVFLLSTQEWNEFADSSMKIDFSHKYVLIYDFEGNDSLKIFAQKYAEQNGLLIYAITDKYPLHYADKNYNAIGPKEFVSLIRNCSCFISNSFHGTAFSIIYHKPVFVFNRNRHQVNSRMESLLTLFELKDCIVSSEKDCGSYFAKTFNWEKIDCIKQSKLQESILYLKQLGI